MIIIFLVQNKLLFAIYYLAHKTITYSVSQYQLMTSINEIILLFVCN